MNISGHSVTIRSLRSSDMIDHDAIADLVAAVGDRDPAEFIAVIGEDLASELVAVVDVDADTARVVWNTEGEVLSSDFAPAVATLARSVIGALVG